ncbi:hypothetical protein IF1G_08055 [Cordyceps javanica]|uniref:Uncharacterized protein n=1 Tax=Cordyceps javanica TaxID=43265 RepID=A0A545UVI3_9HYPO|nr:hypothetical protein IF1G_08055 [Cordyceps javanica]
MVPAFGGSAECRETASIRPKQVLCMCHGGRCGEPMTARGRRRQAKRRDTGGGPMCILLGKNVERCWERFKYVGNSYHWKSASGTWESLIGFYGLLIQPNQGQMRWRSSTENKANIKYNVDERETTGTDLSCEAATKRGRKAEKEGWLFLEFSENEAKIVPNCTSVV